MKEGKRLVLRIKAIWLSEIMSGKKKVEYRDNTDFYFARIGKHLTDKSMTDTEAFSTVFFYLGNVPGSLSATFEVTKIVSSVRNNRYEIHLGKKVKNSK